MLAELFGSTILLTVFHNNKSPQTEPTNTLSATVRGNYNGKHSLVLFNEGKMEQEDKYRKDKCKTPPGSS